jgi:NAD(P)-dependent dehydrogenase (short-subunit alcohol dehydrogenase family)
MRCDLLDPESVQNAVREASADAPIDILVHAAGRFAGESVGDVTRAIFDHAMQLAVRAPFFAAQELMRVRAAGGEAYAKSRADVIIVGALDAGQSLPLPPHFAAGEGAKSALAMSLAKELGPFNVRVNAVSIGLLEGGMSAALSDSMASDFAAFSALGRRGRAEEVAKAVAFLALDSDFLSGKTLPVSGGL